MENKAYSIIVQSLERKLRSGELTVGDRLPSERALAESFGISRASVREAIRVLEAMGLVRSGVGSGPSAGAAVVSEPSAALGWGLRMHLASKFLPVSDVVATREQLESRAASDAANLWQGTSDKVTMTRAARCLDELDDPNLPDARFHELDAQFHLLISSLGGNVVVTTILDSLRQATVGYVQEGVPRITDWPEVKRHLQEQHRGILAAVKDRDAELAAERVSAHIRWFFGVAYAENSSPVSFS
ncbi:MULTISPECIES: FadR/GntR family transcriptional regulator [Kocuria]|uniref:FadR/GntR family transcriptional regulator n=1 Tax=Kocuria TaxID=57493 RepID=UPI000A4C1BFC|nr:MULTISPECIES: GntR family transcriptional regulator [Kocuria]MCT1368530.1 GntR family transcriptional regulator [Rothia sp. p3-SID1597]